MLIAADVHPCSDAFARQDKVFDEVSAAILGGVAAENTTHHRPVGAAEEHWSFVNGDVRFLYF